MGNKMIDKAVNPFIQIAGARALAWGALGLLVSTVICYYAGYHYHEVLSTNHCQLTLTLAIRN